MAFSISPSNTLAPELEIHYVMEGEWVVRFLSDSVGDGQLRVVRGYALSIRQSNYRLKTYLETIVKERERRK